MSHAFVKTVYRSTIPKSRRCQRCGVLEALAKGRCNPAVIPCCDTCDGTLTGKTEVDWTGEQYGPCTCPPVADKEGT